MCAPTPAPHFDAQFALEKGQEGSYSTERAVFRLKPEGLVLTEIAPGINLDQAIRPVVNFDLKISPNLSLMDERLFKVEPMGLKNSPAWV